MERGLTARGISVPMSDNPHGPTARHAFLAGCGGLLVLGCAGALLGVVGALVNVARDGKPHFEEAFTEWGMLGLPVQHAMLAGLALYLGHRFGGWRRVLAWRAPSRWWPLLFVLPIGLISDWVAQLLYEHAPWLNLGGLDMLGDALTKNGTLGTVMVGLGAVVAAPIAEELLFRGFVYRSAERSWGPVGAIAVSTLLFAAIHGDPLHALAVVPFGVFMGWLRWRTGSVWPGILAHMLNNGLWMATALLIGEVPDVHIGVTLACIAAVGGLMVGLGRPEVAKP